VPAESEVGEGPERKAQGKFGSLAAILCRHLTRQLGNLAVAVEVPIKPLQRFWHHLPSPDNRVIGRDEIERFDK
jgi:hypothetical protein